MLGKTLESPLDCKEIQPVHSKEDQSWVFIGRTDVEAETPILWPPDAKSWLIGKDWCWEELEAGGEGDDRGWDGWMASPTRWTWVWVNSGSWWWRRRPGMLRAIHEVAKSWTWLSDWSSEQSALFCLTPKNLSDHFYFLLSPTVAILIPSFFHHLHFVLPQTYLGDSLWWSSKIQSCGSFLRAFDISYHAQNIEPFHGLASALLSLTFFYFRAHCRKLLCTHSSLYALPLT